MKKKYLLIAISALFLLTFSTSCGNGKSTNDKSGIEENIENSDKYDAEKNDSLIHDFITNMYEKELYYNYDFLEAHCTKKMLKYLKDEYEYEYGGDGYAGYLFRTGAQDDKPGAEDVKDKVLKITKDSEGWYHYTFTDGGWRGENKIKVRVENGKVMVDEVERVNNEYAEAGNREFEEIESSMIDSLHFDEKVNHVYKIADTRKIPDMGNDQYSVCWYVDTVEWGSDLKKSYIYSKIEFKKGVAVIASFCDDDGWSYIIGDENSKAIMFKSFKLDSNHTALVFRGGVYSDGVSTLTVFVLSGNEVKLVFNKLYDIEKIEKDKVFLVRDKYAEKPIKCGYLSFLDGHISIVSKEYPKGKIIF
jgi:hypothetical protein